MTYNIDWTKPIEAYHPDGRVVPQEVEHMGEEPWTVGSIAGGVWNKDGTPWEAPEGEEDWRIRNRKSDNPLCVDTLRKVLEVLPEPDHRTSDRWRIEAIEDCRAAIQALLPKDRAGTLVEEWGADPLSAAVARDFARWLEDNGHLKDEP